MRLRGCRGVLAERSGLPVSFARRSLCCLGLRRAASPFGNRSYTGSFPLSCSAAAASSAAISSRMALEASSAGSSSSGLGCSPAAACALRPCRSAEDLARLQDKMSGIGGLLWGLQSSTGRPQHCPL